MDLAIIQKCAPDVHPYVIQRMMTVESRHNPFAIGFKIVKDGIEYRLPRKPKNQEDAKHIARWLYDRGFKFDAGIAQINSINFARMGLTPETVFDTCLNLNASSKILIEFYQSAKRKFNDEQVALHAAIRAYNSGRFATSKGQEYLVKITNVNFQVKPSD